MSVTIYHNPRCTKSRQTLALLEARGIKPQVIEYLQTPPSAKQLDAILKMLGMAPRDLMRKQEAPYGEQNLASPEKTRAQLIEAMIASPILIERPIVVSNGKAAIGRPPENILEIL
ncbi:MAG TPA: arsenate reductase (glutaredoxin) [Alphaproteobacteria bacterium]|nr:arsenate reductase (glutaredoxin) [Alphaproteobacteria bacterium]HEX4888970.1 arsenate reductase (glutaredoxin) [Alphaproteobacteria bacterium]